MKNYELLGRKWSYNWDVPGTIAYWQECDSKLKDSSRANHCRYARINNKLFYPCLQHLGFGPINPALIRKEVEEGVDLALQYFDDQWWRVENMDREGLQESAFHELLQRNTMRMDKSASRNGLQWFTAFTASLFLGGLSNRWNDIAKICSWFDADIGPEYTAGELEDEYMLLFVCIAGSLRPEPMEGVEEVLAKVKRCRTKRPRLLCAAWEAANAADQAAFDKAFKESVGHFLSKPEDGQIHDCWIAKHQSVIWLIAEHRGLNFPPLPEKHRAAIVTRESSGLL